MRNLAIIIALSTCLACARAGGVGVAALKGEPASTSTQFCDHDGRCEGGGTADPIYFGIASVVVLAGLALVRQFWEN
jgi:hypothetical protein